MTPQQSSITNVFAISPFNEYYLPSVNKLTFEKIDSVSLYNNKFKQAEILTDNTLHIFIGMDSGLLANYLLEKSLPLESKYIFVELDEVCQLLTIEIPENLQESVYICTASKLEELLTNSEFNLFIVKHLFKLHYSLAASGNSHDDYTLLSHNVEKIVKLEYFDSSTAFTQKSFIIEQLNNIAENLLPAEILKDTFAGKTCIVLGGGPSLDENIKWIQSNRDKLVIFSVSRITGKLADIGIKSDIIVTVDPQEHSFEVNEKMMSLSAQSLLLSANHTCHDIVAQWNGCLLFTGTQMPWQEGKLCSNIETTGPTVTNSAIHIAESMGFTQILLCGVDFCHSQSGATHTTNTYTESVFNNLGTMYEWVETYSGELAETPIQLIHAIESLAESVALKPEINYINLSKNAAKVKGVSYQDKNQILLSPISKKQLEYLNPSRFIMTTEAKLEKLTLISQNINNTLTHFDKILSKLTNALALCKKMTKISATLIGPLSAELEKIESELNQDFPQYCYLIKFYGFYEFSHFLTTQSTDQWTQKDVNNQNRLYYQAFFDIANELQKLLQQTKARLQSRIAEHAFPTQLALFTPQWEADKHFGRAIIWSREHPNSLKLLDAKDKELIEKLTSRYTELFNKKTVKNVAVDHQNNMNNAFKKLNILLQHKHLLGISKMVQYVEPFRQQDELTAKFYYLAKSYELFLKGTWEESLKIILKIDNNQMSENELRHIIMLSLKLNLLDVAQENLAKIIQFNDEYLPQYAQIMSLQGQYQDALNLYLNYLDKYPNNIPVLIKLGTFLAAINETESAQSVFLQVLKIDPINQTAINNLEQMSR